jgi:sugar phosphate isomerase/epimerase
MNKLILNTRKNQKPDNSMSRRNFIGKVLLATTAATVISSCKTERYQIGCFTRPWNKYDYRVAFDCIAETGYKYVGLMTHDKGLLMTPDTTPEMATEIREEAKKRGLIIAGAYGQNFDVKNSIDEGITGLQRLIDSCSIAGCPDVMLGGIFSPELDEPYYKVIAECCDYAAEKGVRLNIKPHGNTITTGLQCRQRIEQINHENFRLWYDPGNIFWYTKGELDPVDDVADVKGLVVGMCIKDFRRPNIINITPGTGDVDFPKVLTSLRAGGFTRGPLLVEAIATGELDYTNAEAVKTREFLEDLIS